MIWNAAIDDKEVNQDTDERSIKIRHLSSIKLVKYMHPDTVKRIMLHILMKIKLEVSKLSTLLMLM